MKRLIAIAAAIVIPTLAVAQPFVRNDEIGTYIVGNGDHQNSAASVDAYGQQYITASTPVPVTIPNGLIDPSNNTTLSIPAVSNGTNGIEVIRHDRSFVVADTAETGSGQTQIVATSHVARRGDVIEMTGGTAGNLGAWSEVCSITLNAINLCGSLPAAAANGDAFNIYRPRIGAEMTPSAMITIIPTAVPTAYSTPQFANTTPLKTYTVDNSNGDVEIWCAIGGLTATSFRVPAGSVYTDNPGQRGNVMSGAIGCIHPAATPSAGTIVIYGSK